MKNYLIRLEEKLESLMQETKKRKKAAKKSKIEHYFAGQQDAFNQVLLELKVVKYEQNMPEDTAEVPVTIEAPAIQGTAVVDTEIQDQSETLEETTKVPTARKKVHKRKKAQPEKLSPAMIAAKELLQQAVEAGVITQKISLYLYEDFPNGKLRGRTPVLELLTNENLAEKIAGQIAVKQQG